VETVLTLFLAMMKIYLTDEEKNLIQFIFWKSLKFGHVWRPF